MNLFELFVKIGVDDQASKNISGITSKLGNGLKTAAKIGTAAVTAAAAGITALTTAAVKNYAEYEQLVGGAELMFGKAFDTVKKNSQEAYKTVQMSQNEYLQQVNGFATGLKTALGGNEQAAAELSHEIIKAEADIIAATGNTAENVQNAFNGIMKSNFTMLDNLQIGITPTKEGFQEVIDKVNEWNKANGEATNYQMGNLADMQSALVDYIEMQGLAGYASDEAAKTISGSLASMKSAWSNLIAGIADDNADFDVLINNMVESGGAFGENILPRIEIALDGAVKLIEGLFPKIIEALPNLINTLLPSIVNGALNIVQSFVTAISDNGDLLVQSAIDAAMTLANGILSMLPEIIKLGLDLIVSLANGIAEALPELIPTIIDVVLQIVDTLTNPEQLSKLLEAALTLVTELAFGLIDAIPQLVDAVFDIIDNLVVFLLDPNNIAKILNAALKIVIGLGAGLINAIPRLLGSADTLIKKLIDNFKNTDWGEVGKNIIDGLLEGLKKAWESLKKWFSNAWDNLIGTSEKKLEIGSPSKRFRRYGKWTAEGYGRGFEEEFADVERNIENDFANLDADTEYGITTSTTSIYDIGGGNIDKNSGVSIVQNIYSEAKTAADLMEEARWQARMGVLMGV